MEEEALVNQTCLCSGMVERWRGKKKKILADDLLPVDHYSASA